MRDLIVPVAESSAYLLSAGDLALCGRELDNVRAALDWSFSPEGDAAIGVPLTAAFAPILSQTVAGRPGSQTLSLFGECRDRIEKTLALHGADLGLSAALERRMLTAYGLASTLAPVAKSGRL